MSKENAVKFLQAVDADQDLNKKLSSAPKTMDGWMSVAKASGFEVSADDVRWLSEQASGQPQTDATAIPALVSAGEQMSDKALEGVAGGLLSSYNSLARYNFSAFTRAFSAFDWGAASFAKDTGPSWVNSPSGFFGDN